MCKRFERPQEPFAEFDDSQFNELFVNDTGRTLRVIAYSGSNFEIQYTGLGYTVTMSESGTSFESYLPPGLAIEIKGSVSDQSGVFHVFEAV